MFPRGPVLHLSCLFAAQSNSWRAASVRSLRAISFHCRSPECCCRISKKRDAALPFSDTESHYYLQLRPDDLGRTLSPHPTFILTAGALQRELELVQTHMSAHTMHHQWVYRAAHQRLTACLPLPQWKEEKAAGRLLVPLADFIKKPG